MNIINSVTGLNMNFNSGWNMGYVKKYSTIKEDKCAICLQKYKGVDIIKEFPCKHIFHKNCILKWIKNSNKCPLCKYDITNDVNKVELKNYNDDEDDEEQDM